MNKPLRRNYKEIALESGARVRVPRVSMLSVLRKLERKFAQPEVPTMVVNVAGEEIVQENASDPAYRQALIDRQNKLSEEAVVVILNRAARIQQIDDDQAAEMQQMREDFADEEFHEDDTVMWFWEVALAEIDVTEFVKIATGQADPSASGVQKEIENF